MPHFYCPFCDQALTRCAKLALRLEKTTDKYHKDMGHPGIWINCNLEPCDTNRKVIKGIEDELSS